MKFQKILLLITVCVFSSLCFFLCGFSFFKEKQNVPENNISRVSIEKQTDNLWCITLQLVWNEFSDKFAGGKAVNFEGGNPPLADELNKKSRSKKDISEGDCYITQGEISTALKKRIEREIYAKFKEKSDILNLIDWSAKDSYLFYSFLKKEFNFPSAFNELNSAPFNDSAENVKYFGIKSNSDKKIRENAEVLFYNSPDEYAVKLSTKEKEDVILYRTLSETDFDDLFSYIEENSVPEKFNSKDELIIPEITIDKTISYTELCNKKIINTNYVISQALQTIKFKMDNKGGSLKSEAAIAVMRTSLLPPAERPRYFLFNKPFVLFLKEKDKNKPYFAVRIDGIEYLVKD